MPEKMPDRIIAGYVSRAEGKLKTKEWEPSDSTRFEIHDDYAKLTPTLKRAGDMRTALQNAYLRLPMLLGKTVTREDIDKILDPIHDVITEIEEEEKNDTH